MPNLTPSGTPGDFCHRARFRRGAGRKRFKGFRSVTIRTRRSSSGRTRPCHGRKWLRCQQLGGTRVRIPDGAPFSLLASRLWVWVWAVRFHGGRRWRTLVVHQLQRLFELAEAAVDQGDEELGRHYLGVARRMVLRTRVRLPRELRMRYCHRCGQLFRVGSTARVRIRSEGQTKYLVITCLACGSRRKLVWQPSKAGSPPRGGERPIGSKGKD
jgi:ribonuclease P protein subunit RPR2